jgi:predicted lipoprotein
LVWTFSYVLIPVSDTNKATANDDIIENPEKHGALIWEMKLETALITNNSPYAEVRAVVDNTDDPSLPVSTIRAWVIGLIFSGLLGFVNQLFSIRQPRIYIDSNVAQLLAFPLGT